MRKYLVVALTLFGLGVASIAPTFAQSAPGRSDQYGYSAGNAGGSYGGTLERREYVHGY